jgi:hypothetical protein
MLLPLRLFDNGKDKINQGSMPPPNYFEQHLKPLLACRKSECVLQLITGKMTVRKVNN